MRIFLKLTFVNNVIYFWNHIFGLLVLGYEVYLLYLNLPEYNIIIMFAVLLTDVFFGEVHPEVITNVEVVEKHVSRYYDIFVFW